MDVEVEKKGKSTRTITINANQKRLEDVKSRSLKRLGKDLTVKGFRKGKAPEKAIEKHLGENAVQAEVLEDAVNFLYLLAINEKDLRPIDRPKIEVKKYVPYTELELSAEIEVVPQPKLGDYKSIKKKTPEVEVSADEVNEVVNNLRTRAAEKKDVDRKAKDGDEVWIDFEGFDKKGKEVQGASGKDYPLALGSGTFIPGFEENLVGTKKADKKEFELTFPKNYGAKKLAGQKVDFKVTVKHVKEVVLPKADDAFAKTVGPFESIAQMKKDIKQQVLQQKTQEATNKVKDEILEELLKKSDVEAPQTLVDDQLRALKDELNQNIMYRGMTPEMFYEQEGMSEDEYTEKMLKPQAEKRVKVGLILSEVVNQEKLSIADDEVDIRVQLLQGQYQDPQMQAQLASPEGKQDLANRMLTEKAVNTLYEYATK